MKKSIIKLLLIAGIGACLIFTGCTDNYSYNAGTYKIVGSDSNSCVLINVEGTIKEAKICMGTPMDDIDSLIGSYVVVDGNQKVINIKKEGNK